MVSFFRLYETISVTTTEIKKIPFFAAGKEYILSLTGRPTYAMFPYSSYSSGSIYEISFYPSERAGMDREEKFARTGDNSITSMRDILRQLNKI